MFRCDASREIGTGHIMRCLTLAQVLTECGADCQFICRTLDGHMGEFIRSKGYVCHLLDESSERVSLPIDKNQTTELEHSQWLGVNWVTDAEQVAHLLVGRSTDWLVVDNYALDTNWEESLQLYYRKVMVIDDLADRKHRTADILLDQTLGRLEKSYRRLVNSNTKLLLGANYALLRPEFAKWRNYSLKRRAIPQLKNILVNLGGVDKDNVTGKVLKFLAESKLPADCEIVVVMGSQAPHLELVRQQATSINLNITVLSDVNNMAELMANADFAIGAAGASTWERCCLGLPSIVVVLASNQRFIAKAMEDAGAAIAINSDQLDPEKSILLNPEFLQLLKQMSNVCASVTHGSGAEIVSQQMRKLCV